MFSSLKFPSCCFSTSSSWLYAPTWYGCTGQQLQACTCSTK